LKQGWIKINIREQFYLGSFSRCPWLFHCELNQNNDNNNLGKDQGNLGMPPFQKDTCRKCKTRRRRNGTTGLPLSNIEVEMV